MNIFDNTISINRRILRSGFFWLFAIISHIQMTSVTAQGYKPTTTGDIIFDQLIEKEYAFYKQTSFDSALTYSRAAFAYANRSNKNELLIRSFYYLGSCYTSLNQYDSARYYLDKALSGAIKLKDKKLEAQCYNSFAVYYNLLSDNATSINFLIKAATLLEESNDEELKKLLPTVYSNIGYIFDSEKEYSKSIIYHKKAYENKNYISDSSQLVMIYQNFFVAHLNNKNIGLSKKYLDSASMFNKNFRASVREVYIRNNYGLYYEAKHDTANALRHYKSAYLLCDSINNRYFQSTVGINISRLLYGRNQLNESLFYATSAYRTAGRLKNYADAAAAYKLASDIEKQTGNLLIAFQHLDSFSVYTDSLNAQETRKNILGLETKYQAGQREKEIALLRSANAEKELAVIKRNRLLAITGLSAGGLILLLGLFYRNSKQKQEIAEKDKLLKDEQIRFLERQQQVVSLQSMINGQETERTRIAKDLHDGLGGLFSTIKMYFSSLQHERRELEEEPLFKKSFELIHNASEEVRRIAHNMMPEVLLKIGLVQATRELCASISAGKLLNVSFQSYGMDQRLNASTEIMLYRILQELLNNIMKHAQATEAIIQFNREGNRLSITVEDNGKGFNLTREDEGNHSGLSSVQSRVQYLNGKLSIDSQQEMGTTVLMDFLINEPPAQ